jgi:hypothetical protein
MAKIATFGHIWGVFYQIEGKENVGNASTTVTAERIPLAQLHTLSKLGGRGETEQPLA